MKQKYVCQSNDDNKKPIVLHIHYMHSGNISGFTDLKINLKSKKLSIAWIRRKAAVIGHSTAGLL